MADATNELNRRRFLKTGLQATAGAAVLGTGIASAAAPKDKKVTLIGSMATRVLGKTGIEVPVLGYGGVGVVEMFEAEGTLEERAALIRHAYDKGVRWFDTADNYPDSEAIFGNGLKGVRDNVYLATKVSNPRTPEATRQIVETSLTRFQTDYIDCIQIHACNGWPFETAMNVYERLVKLRDEGMVRFIGVTGHNGFDKIYALIKTGAFDTAFLAQGYFNFGMRNILTNAILEYRKLCIAKARELGMGVMAMKVLRYGMFGARWELAKIDWGPEKVRRLPGAAIRYLFQDERTHIFNVGMRFMSEIDQNVETFSSDMTFTDADRQLLAEFSASAYAVLDQPQQSQQRTQTS